MLTGLVAVDAQGGTDSVGRRVAPVCANVPLSVLHWLASKARECIQLCLGCLTVTLRPSQLWLSD